MIITSEEDLASLTIQEALTELRIPFHQVKEAPIYANVEIQDNIFIFASKHSSAAGVPSLSVHFPGNWNTANLGGKQKTLCKAAPLEMKEAFLELHKSSPEGLQVTLEVTHHGPVCNTPCFFIEIGSSLEQWKDKALGKIIAKTLKEILNKKPKQYEIALGIGGPHYCNNFNRIELQSNIAFSHICPKHNLEFLDKEMLLQAIEQSNPQPTFAILDWKGLGEHKRRITSLLNEIKFPYKRTDHITRESNLNV